MINAQQIVDTYIASKLPFLTEAERVEAFLAITKVVDEKTDEIIEWVHNYVDKKRAEHESAS